MDIDSIVSSLINGDPVHDAFLLGIGFIFFYEFYKVFFSACFSFFKK